MDQVEQMRDTINVVASTVTDSSKMFCKKEELAPVYCMLDASLGWGGLPAAAATYVNVFPEKNDGKTPYTLTVKDVPVDAFWSVTLCDDKGWMPVNIYNAYSFNNVTAKKDEDGSITIHFGGEPKQSNFLPIVPGWNYIVRLDQQRQEILDDTWTFPPAKPVGLRENNPFVEASVFNAGNGLFQARPLSSYRTCSPPRAQAEPT
jgi:hypothetical protein